MSENEKALLVPIQSKSTDSLVLDALVQYVADAGLSVGDKLPSERVLGERLGVSRNTVREAVKRWEALGIVQRRKGSGTFISSVVKPGDNFVSLCVKNDVEHMLHSLELRRIIETEACAFAAVRASKQDLQDIERCIIEIERCYDDKEVGGQQDWAFHCAIYHSTHNPMFEALVSGLYDAFHAFLDAPAEQQATLSSVKLHRQLYEAIRTRKPVLARNLCHKIIDVMEGEMKKPVK